MISSEKIKDFAIIGPAKQDEFQKNNEKVIEENLLLVDNLKGFAMFLNLDELSVKSKFIKQTAAGQTESSTHIKSRY